jgi:hypothetical protein
VIRAGPGAASVADAAPPAAWRSTASRRSVTGDAGAARAGAMADAHTPDSVGCRHLSPRTARAAPGSAGITRLAVAAAMRTSAVVVTRPESLPRDEPVPHTLLPISRRSRLATDIAAGAGALLPHPFSPHLSLAAIGGFALCCRLASRRPFGRAPLLAVSQGSLPGVSRPGWESGSSSRVASSGG